MKAAAMRTQRGVVLFIALIVLVAMSLAGIAMIRSVDTALGIAGNMAFKQAATQGTDLGVQAAYDWLSTQPATALHATNPALRPGYFSSRPAAEPNWFDPGSWGQAVSLNGGVPDQAGNVVRFVIHRMCTESNTPYNGTSPGGVPNQCALYVPPSAGTSGGSMLVGAPQFEGIPQVYYRVTARVDGPRNSVSVAQASILIQP